MSTAVVTITGWIATDPDIRDGGRTPFAMFSIAVSRGFEDNKTTTWFRVKGFGKFWTDKIEKLNKGDLVLINGEIELQEFETNGETRQSLVVYPTFMRTLKRGESSKSDEGRGRGRSTTQSRGRGRRPEPEDLDDEIPF